MGGTRRGSARPSGRRVVELRLALPRRRSWLGRLALHLGLVLVVAGIVAGGVSLLQSWTRTTQASRTEPVQPGAVEIAATGEAILVRPEHVQVAAVAGQVDKLVPAGRLVRVGTPVVRLTGAGGATTITAERPGLVSYGVDGLETELTAAVQGLESGNLRLGPEWAQQLPLRRFNPTANSVAAGAPLFKLVDPAQVWAISSLAVAPLASVQPGSPVDVQFPDLEGRAQMRVSFRSPPAGDKVLVVLEAQGQFPEGLLSARRTPARLLINRYEGMVVPRTAITVQDQIIGVWARVSGVRRFVPITLIGGDNERVAVQGNLAVGDEVWVTEPRP